MKQKLTWQQVAQWTVVLLSAFALKFYYSGASANGLRWILAPTTFLVELATGISFAFESYAGYVSKDQSFVIAPSCAGVNFLIAAFWMLSARRLLKGRAQNRDWGFIPVAALIAYLVTLVANTVRIAIALQLRQLPEVNWLKANDLHRIEGIFVYAGFLLLLFILSEKISAGKISGLWRQSLLPLLAYYLTALGIPLLNGGYQQGAEFWAHAFYVVLIPLLLILLFAAVHKLWKRLCADSNVGVETSEALQNARLESKA
jgi:exosortase K